MFIVKVQRKIESLNTYKRWHWSRRSKERKFFALEIRACLDSTPKEAFKKVVIISHRKRLLDKDNLWGGAKPLIDALRDNNLIADDDVKSINLRIGQVKSGRNFTTIILN